MTKGKTKMTRENEYPIYRFRKIWFKPAKKEENPVNVYEFDYDIISGRTEQDQEIKQELTLKCSEEPVESFKKTLQALKPHIVDLCEQPKDYEARVTVRGIHIRYSDHENGSKIMGITMTGTYKLKRSNGVNVLNTPFKQESYTTSKGGDETKLLSEPCAELVYELFDEAKRYVQGERLKLMIDFKEQEAQDKKANLESYKENKKKSKEKGVDDGGNIINLDNSKN
jgi:hypothetical protein